MMDTELVEIGQEMAELEGLVPRDLYCLVPCPERSPYVRSQKFQLGTCFYAISNNF